MGQTQKKELRTFFIIVIILVAITSYLRSTGFSAPGSYKLLFALIHMWGPGIAAIATKLIHQGNLKDIRWRLGKPKYLVIAYFIPLIIIFIAYSIVWLTGLGGVSIGPLAKLITDAAPIFNGLPVIVLFSILAIYGVIRNLISATGEEIGWTGFLTPAFLKTMSPIKASIAIGLIWAVWHYPIIIFGEYNVGTTLWVAIPSFTIMIIGFSFFRTWLWIRSASLWTGCILHASHNLFIQGFFDNLTIDTGNTKLFTTEFGCATALIYILVAVLILIKFRKNERLNKLQQN